MHTFFTLAFYGNDLLNMLKSSFIFGLRFSKIQERTRWFLTSTLQMLQYLPHPYPLNKKRSFPLTIPPLNVTKSNCLCCDYPNIRKPENLWNQLVFTEFTDQEIPENFIFCREWYQSNVMFCCYGVFMYHFQGN